MAQDNNQQQQADLLRQRIVSDNATNGAAQAPLLINQPADMRQAAGASQTGAPSSVGGNDALVTRLVAKQQEQPVGGTEAAGGAVAGRGQSDDLPLPPGFMQRRGPLFPNSGDVPSERQRRAPSREALRRAQAATRLLSTEEDRVKYITSGLNEPVNLVPKQAEDSAEDSAANTDEASSGQRAVYDAIDRRLSQLPQISEADVETARQRHKRNAMIGALGDGLRALSNLYFTTKGAPSSYVPSGVQEREQERYQRIVNARQAADDERLRLTMLADNLRRQDEAAASKAGMAELDRQYKWARVQQISQRIETDRMNLQLASERLQQLIAKGAAQADIDAATIALRQAQTNLANSRAALVGVQTEYYPSLARARAGAANRSNRGRTSTSNYTYDPYGNNMTSKTTTVTVDGVDDIVMPGDDMVMP